MDPRSAGMTSSSYTPPGGYIPFRSPLLFRHHVTMRGDHDMLEAPEAAKLSTNAGIHPEAET
jgi:hypothetical protein